MRFKIGDDIAYEGRPGRLKYGKVYGILAHSRQYLIRLEVGREVINDDDPTLQLWAGDQTKIVTSNEVRDEQLLQPERSDLLERTADSTA